MNLFANLLRSAWARITRGQETRHATARLPVASEKANGLGALSTDELLKNGRARLQAGDLVAAERHFGAATGKAPDSAEAQFYLGVALLKQKRYEDAIDSFILALHYRPDFVEARFQLGLARFHLEQFDDAIECFRKVIEQKPDYADAHCNLGYALYKHLDDLDAAETHLRRALELDPQSADAQINLAMVFAHRGESDVALRMYEGILQRKPDDPEARLNRALILLTRGDYADGWRDYEARRALQAQRDFRLPEWDGAHLGKRVILVHAEQGLGDEIMFASCLGELIDRAQHCVIECHVKLEKLFRRSFPAATVHGSLQTDPDLSWVDELPRIDVKVGIGSLPLRFRRSRRDFPGHAGYLRADPARVEHWRARLRRLGSGPKVGVSWRGGARSTRRHARSIPLEHWMAPLSLSGAQFVSLQYGDCRDEIESACGKSRLMLHHWPEAIEDYDETAALVSALDLVISVQTAVVHLAGALGKAVWVLVSARPEWRYGSSGDTMPWYPSARLFRQGGEQRWDAVIQRVADALKDWTVGPNPEK